MTGNGANSTETVAVGDRVFVRPRESPQWAELPKESASSRRIEPRTILTTLERRCEVEDLGTSYRTKLRSRDGSCGGAGTAVVQMAEGQISRVELDMPTEIGRIRTKATITPRRVPPITVPGASPDAN